MPQSSSKPPRPPSSPAEILRAMSLEQKAGQVLCVGFDGTSLDDGLRRMIEQFHIGGVIFFARNVAWPAATARLANALQQAALESGNPGLLVAIDQEGGRVARLTEDKGYTQFPSPMALAAAGDPESTRLAAQAMAAEMKAVGINTDFAPVLDVNNNPSNPIIGTRSFGTDPQQVAAHGVAFTQGLQQGGLLAFGKHFPGHGDSSVDSHLSLPVIEHTRQRLEALEFVPFRATIQAGIAGIMSAHASFLALDPAPNLAATLSPRVLTGLLRQELGYDGLLATDSLEMGALAESGYPAPLAAATALAAGADLLLFNGGPAFSPDFSEHIAAYNLIIDGVRRGQIPERRLDEAVLRILSAKQRFNLLQPAPADPEAAATIAGSPQHRLLSRALAARSITLLRDDAALLPLPGGPDGWLVIEAPSTRTFAEGKASTAPTLLGQLLGAQTLQVSARPTPDEIQAAVEQAAGRRAVIVAVEDAAFSSQRAELARALHASGAPLVVAAVRGPYDLIAFPAVSTYLTSYGSSPPALEALAAVLTGAAAPQGRLPVSLPGLYTAGSGLRGFSASPRR